MAQQDDEQTIVRFTLDGIGKITEINELPKRLTPYAMEPGA